MPAGVQNQTGKNGFFPNGNFTFTDNFKGTLDQRWVGVRGPKESFATTTKKGLEITPYDVTIKAVAPTSTMFYRQQHLNFTATTTLKFQPQSDKDLAGIVCYQSEKFNYVFGITQADGKDYLILQRTEKGVSKTIASTPVDAKKAIKLQVQAKGDQFQFNYAVGGKKFQNLGGTVSGDILSTNVAGGFTGNMIGLYATSANDVQP